MILCAQDPSGSPGYAAYRQADQLFAAKKVPEAVKALEQSLKQDDKLFPALTLYARIAMSMNRFELARDSLDRALEVEPKSAYAQFLYGLSFYLANDLVHARPRFEAARRLDPKDARPALHLGMTYESLGETKEAMQQYEDAVRLHATVEAYLAGVRLLYLEGRLDECRRWVDLALQLEPESRDAHFEKARLLLLEHEFPAAAAEGEKALALSRGDVTDRQIHYLLVRAYRTFDADRADRHALALRALEK